MKRKFGDTHPQQDRHAQRNELLLKVLCHNIVCVIHEIQGQALRPRSRRSDGLPKNDPAAQQTDEIR